jgi:3-oxoacyl-[acyl-carrier protein] reductase
MVTEIEVTGELVWAFAVATGDYSSIHVDPQYARKTAFREPIVHGMLPLLVVVGRLCPENQGGRRVRLAAIDCRFREFARVGERLRFETQKRSSQGSSETWSFDIRRAADNSLVTSGKAVFVPAPDVNTVSARKCTGLIVQPVQEARYAASALRVGTSERLTLCIDPLVLEPVLRLVDAQIGPPRHSLGFADRSVTALVALSTLIGMRLPGRSAAFLEFEAAFPSALDGRGDVILEATVADVGPSGSRIRLDVTWTQSSQVVGTGVAFSMVSAASEAVLSCAAIKTSHLNLGIGGRVALVTGASRGIGEATSKMLAMNGARVVVHFFRGQADAETIVGDIRSNDGQAIALQADLADEDSIVAMFRAIEAEFGPVDILVNNAVGSFTPKATEGLRPADYLAELNISLFGMHACCRLALPHMRRQRWGKIINMGTIATELPAASQNKYITVKSAVVGYTRSLASETADDNIQVNLVAPSMTQTSLIAGLPPALVERLAQDSPGGALLTAIEVAKVVVFLASDWAACLSGQQTVLTKGGPPFT